MTDVHELATRPERVVYGEHVLAQVPIDMLARLPQMRSGLNPELLNIKEDIKANGLINQIDVAYVDGPHFERYIAFVNRVWGTKVSLEIYAQQRQPDGTYFLIVAGHTRHEALLQLQREDEMNAIYEVVVKVHPVSHPQEIIMLQYGENTHSQVSPEQKAMGMVETYFQGKEEGLWKNKAEFLNHPNTKFNRYELDQAMGFVKLPPEARELIDHKTLPFSVGVALGSATDTVMAYVKKKITYEDDASDEKARELDEAYRTQITLLIMSIFNQNLNISKAKKYIAGQVEMMKAQLRGPGYEGAQALQLFIPPEELVEAYHRQKDKELKRAILEMKDRSVKSVETVIGLCVQLAGKEEMLAECEEEHAIRVEKLGRTSVEQLVALAS